MKRLPVVAIIKETLLVVWQKRLALSRGLMAAALASAALDTALSQISMNLGSASLVFLAIALFLILNGAVFTVFAVTCHRIVLLDEGSVPRYGLRSWTARETRFVGWILVSSFYFMLYIVPILVMTFLLYLAVVLTGLVGKEYAKYLGGFGVAVGLVAATYVVSRLAVLFPATAIGERRNTDWAFEITAKNGWRIVIATAFVGPVSFGIHAALPADNGLLFDFLIRFVDAVFMAIGIVALSLSFRFLSSISPYSGGANGTIERDARQAARPSL